MRHEEIDPPASDNAYELTYPVRETPRADPWRQLRAALYRQRIPMLLAFGTIVLLGLLYTVFVPREYTAVASVQFEQQAPRVISLPDLDPQPAVQDSERFLQTQLDLVRSRQIAERVTERLKITSNPNILEGLAVEPEEGRKIEDSVFLALQDRMRAEIGINTRIAQISFVSRDPVVSAQIANAFARELIEVNLDAKLETSNQALGFLEEQLADAKAKLEDSEQRMLTYARNANLSQAVSGNGGVNGGGATLRERELAGLTDAMALATARRIDAEQRWQQVRQTAPQLLANVQDNRAFQELLGERAKAQAALDEERERYTEEYPTVVEMQAEVRGLDAQINGLAENIRRTAYEGYATAAKQERRLNQTIAGMKSAALAEKERGIQYNSLQREVDTNKVFYDGLLQRYQQIAAASGAPAANVSLIDRAQASLRPTSPNVPQNLALAGLLGVFAAMGLALVREKTNDLIRSGEDMEEVSGIPLAGVVPVLENSRDIDEALADPSSVQSEAINSLAVGIKQLNGGGLPSSLLVTSSMPVEGKTTTSIGLARSLATMGYDVVLVDGDLRHPSLQSRIPNLPDTGLAELLESGGSPEKALYEPEGELFKLVPSGTLEGSPIQALTHNRLQPVLDAFKKKSDIVIVDGPPILGLADAIQLADSVEVVLMAAESNFVERDRFKTASNRLPSGVKVGGVLTKFDPKLAGVTYNNSNYYSY